MSAQSKPNFSGVWVGRTVSESKNPFVGQPWAQGQRVTITQDANTITLAYVSTGRSHSPVRLVFNLDGTETINESLQVPASPTGARQLIKSKAEWEGDNLILISFWDRPAEPRDEGRARFTLESVTSFRLETTRPATGAKSIASFQRASP
jgi:hypothetical protein